MARRRNSGNYADNVAGGVAQGLMAYLALARQQETLDQQKALNAAHADYYKARTDEIAAERADAASFAKLGTPVATEDVPVGAGGPVAAPITSHDLKDNVAPKVTSDATGARAPIWQRNNNPGNIRTVDGKGYQSFPDMQTGLGAMSALLDRYQNKHGLNTVQGIVGRYAPPNENDTARYIAEVTKELGVAPDAPIDVTDPATKTKLMRAMTRVEGSGKAVTDGMLAKAAGGREVSEAPQELQLSNMLADAGTTMSDAGPGYAMRGSKAIAADMGAAPAQAAPQPGRGLNPAVAAQAAVPQTRAGIMGALDQQAAEIRAKKAQLDQWNPSSAKGMAQKRVLADKLEQEERWLIGRAETEQRAREAQQQQAATNARAEENQRMAGNREERAVRSMENTEAQQKLTNERNAVKDKREEDKAWAEAIKGETEAVARVRNGANPDDPMDKPEKFVDPIKANTLRAALTAAYGDEVGANTPRAQADATTKANFLANLYDTILEKQVGKNATPAQIEAAQRALTPDRLLAAVDAMAKDKFAPQAAAPAQAAPTPAGQPTPLPAPGTPPPAAPAPDKSRADKVIYNRPEVADSFIDSGDASRVEGPKPADPFGPQTGLPTARELGIDLENKRMQDKMEGYRQGIVGGIMPYMPSPATGEADPSLAGDASQVTRPAAPGFGGVGGVVDKLKQGIESLTKRNVDPAELLKRYESATPEERSWIDQNYPQIKDLQNKNLSVVGENGPEVLVTPENQSGYVVPVEDESAYKLLAMGTPGFAEGGDYGGGRDHESDSDSGDSDSGFNGGDRGMDAGSLGGFDRGGTGSDLDGSDYSGHDYASGRGGSDSSGRDGGSSSNPGGSLGDGGILGGKFRDAYAAAPSIRSQGMTTAETMDSMTPSQRAAYAGNVEGINESPFSAFGGDMQSDNTPQSRAGSMFADAKAKQIAESINLGSIINQGLQAAGYQTAQEAPVGGVWSALYAGDVSPKMTSDYGYRTHPVTGQTQSFHNAVDLAAPAGSMLTTSTNGTVEDVGYQKNLGNYATVRDENGYSYTFGHLDSPSVKTGQTVSAGDVIGQQGATGRVTGEHVHYSVRDPQGGSVNPSTHHGISSRR